MVTRPERSSAASSVRWARALTAIALVWVAAQGFSYSFLTHQQLVDLAWTDSIRPVLLARYPHTTEEQLRRAHSFAYGGATIQDIGYYPFGHEFFSDLTHYVRTGDFVAALLRDSSNVYEYAFAIGALSHYLGDNIGHQDATNIATGIQFPELAKKYGPSVSYDQAPHPHIRTEFAFEVNQLSHHRFAPAAYTRAIGLNVPRRLLERAFLETYGLRLHDVLGRERSAIQSYRSSVRSLLPRVAYAEVVIHRDDFPADTTNEDFEKYQKQIDEAAHTEGWSSQQRGKPGIRTHLLALFIRILPKIGALSDLAIRGPNEPAEQDYVKSVNLCLGRYDALLKSLTEHAAQSLPLENRDLDTGFRIRPGSYPLADTTYAKLLDKLTSAQGTHVVSEALRQNLLDYYSDPEAPNTVKRNQRAWKRVQADLAALQRIQLNAAIEPGR
jgi:hypothetical protein